MRSVIFGSPVSATGQKGSSQHRQCVGQSPVLVRAVHSEQKAHRAGTDECTSRPVPGAERGDSAPTLSTLSAFPLAHRVLRFRLRPNLRAGLDCASMYMGDRESNPSHAVLETASPALEHAPIYRPYPPPGRSWWALSVETLMRDFALNVSGDLRRSKA